MEGAWRTHFARICECACDSEPITQKQRTAMEDACTHMSTEEARALYTDLCTIQIAIEEGRTPQDVHEIKKFIDVNDFNLLKRFFHVCIDNGQLSERLADCMDLPMEMRMKKWNIEREKLAQDAKLHRMNSEQIHMWSVYMYESRSENAAAYDRTLRKLARTPPIKPREWQELIITSDADLAKKDAFFWYAVQTRRLSIEEKRAVLHKMNKVKNCASDILHKRCSELAEEIFYDIHRPTTTAAAGRRKPNLIRRMFRALMSKFGRR